MSCKRRKAESYKTEEPSGSSSGEETEDLNSDSDDWEDEEEEEENKEEDSEEERKLKQKEDPKFKTRISKLRWEKKGKMVSMNYCSNVHYQGPIENIKGLLNGSVNREIEIKEEEPYKNQRIFKNVSKKWGWQQELRLLEEVKTNGFFKWELIAQRLSEQSGKNFKADEVQNHYFQYYCNGTLGQVWDYEIERKQFECFDHTDPIVCSSIKYFPKVAGQNLREIKFLPHREDFEEFPTNEIEQMVTSVDFSSYYLNNMKNLKMDQEVRSLQLVIVDAYRTVVADRMKIFRLMKDFKLIEQFFFNMQRKNTKQCEIDRYFAEKHRFVNFFHSPNEFIKFYYDCVREKLLKLEIARLYQILATKKNIERTPEAKTMLNKQAPSFLDVGLFLDANQNLVYQKKRKKKSKFTQRKRGR